MHMRFDFVYNEQKQSMQTNSDEFMCQQHSDSEYPRGTTEFDLN